MYKCQYCGKEFIKQNGCTSHERHYCKLNENRQIPNLYVNHKKVECEICGKLIDVANIKRHISGHSKPSRGAKCPVPEHDDLNCYFCGKLCKNRNSLKQHEVRCPKNPNRVAYNNLSSYITFSRKGKTKENCSEIARAAASLKQRYVEGSLIPYNKGKPGTFKNKHHTAETKKKLRLASISNIEQKHGRICPGYDPKGCGYMDNLNTQFGWHLQHAENGGEICIDGYFLDGYDVNLNIAFEYDEYWHYDDIYRNILKQSDIERMKNIMSALHCRFFRYNEKTQVLYEVDEKGNIIIINDI